MASRRKRQPIFLDLDAPEAPESETLDVQPPREATQPRSVAKPRKTTVTVLYQGNEVEAVAHPDYGSRGVAWTTVDRLAAEQRASEVNGKVVGFTFGYAKYMVIVGTNAQDTSQEQQQGSASQEAGV